MGSVIALSELKNEINDIKREMSALTKGMTFTLNELIELSSKLEALELTTLDPADQEGMEAVSQIQAGIKSAISLEVGYDKI
jgi:hypothetical protein